MASLVFAIAFVVVVVTAGEICSRNLRRDSSGSFLQMIACCAAIICLLCNLFLIPNWTNAIDLVSWLIFASAFVYAAVRSFHNATQLNRHKETREKAA